MAEAGRPTIFTAEIAQTICDRLADGEILRAICRTEGFPSDRAVRRWATDDPDGFGARYAAAREAGWHVIAEEIMAISDDGANDTYVDENGFRRTDNDVVQRSRLRVDARKWLLSKMLPKVFGDKTAIEHSGSFSLASLVEASFREPAPPTHGSDDDQG